MNKEKRRCIELKITEQFSLYIELLEPFVMELISMFPESEIKSAIPNIWYKKKEDIIFYCDIDGIEFVKQKYIYDIMFIIEEYIQKKAGDIILHGGAIAYKNMSIAFIQSRKSGKSTLIRALLANEAYEYISDDLLIYKDGKIAGAALPIRVREKLENVIKNTGKYIGKMVDENGEIRNIYIPGNHSKSEFITLKAIILPKYDKGGKNHITELTGAKKIVSIINNIKQYSDMDNLYNCLTNIAHKIRVFELTYYEIEYAEKEIMKLWNAQQTNKCPSICVPNTK